MITQNLFPLAKVVYRVPVDSILYNKQIIIGSMNNVYNELKDMPGFNRPDYDKTMKIYKDNTVIVHLYFKFIINYIRNVIKDRLAYLAYHEIRK